MKKIEVAQVVFLPDEFTVKDIPKMRAFLAKRFPQYGQIHNHTNDGGFRYIYPEIQFKFIKNKPVIIGFNSGFKLLQEIFVEVGDLEIGHKKIEISEKSLQTKVQLIGVAEEMQKYRFLSPWMALNQKNYLQFKKLDLEGRKAKLNRILWGNLKTIAHAFDYWIPDPDQIKVNGRFYIKESKFKGNTMLTFSGGFSANFYIPELLGLGKQVARGFGTVEKDSNEKG